MVYELPIEEEIQSSLVDEQRKAEALVFKKPPFWRDDRGVLHRVPMEPESLADRAGLLRFLSADADEVSEAL